MFALDRLDAVACYPELDGERISAVPAFDAPPTDADGVTVEAEGVFIQPVWARDAG